jgi:predicted PurR-regulated permease PerM
MSVVAIPVALWLFYSQSFVFAMVISILMALVALLEGILKPYMLSRGLPTPMLIILFGVLGGLAVHGVIGIFIGPVVLALFYDLVASWLNNH